MYDYLLAIYFAKNSNNFCRHIATTPNIKVPIDEDETFVMLLAN